MDDKENRKQIVLITQIEYVTRLRTFFIDSFITYTK